MVFQAFKVKAGGVDDSVSRYPAIAILSEASNAPIGTVRDEEVVGVIENDEITGLVVSGTLIVICRLTGRETFPEASRAQAYKVLEPLLVPVGKL